MKEIIQCHKIAKNYRLGATTICALQDITCSFNPGEFSAIAGPSGSGKTTLLSLLGGMLSPTSGEVWFDGELIRKDGLFVPKDLKPGDKVEATVKRVSPMAPRGVAKKLDALLTRPSRRP